MALTNEQIDKLKPHDKVWHHNTGWGVVHMSEIEAVKYTPSLIRRSVDVAVKMRNKGVWDREEFHKPGVFLTEAECRAFAAQHPSRIELAEARDAKLRAQGEWIPGEDEDD